MNLQEHLLTVLAEECAEIAKECSKALRFGLDDKVTLDPEGPRGSEGPTNLEKIIAELNDVLGVARLMVTEEVLPVDWYDPNAQIRKATRVRAFLGYAARVGTFQEGSK